MADACLIINASNKMKIDHIALYCLDLEAMRLFWMNWFGCSSNEQYHNPRTGLRTYILAFPDGGARLEIMQRQEVSQPLVEQMRAGYIHISIGVGSKEAVDEKTALLQSAGYECLSGPRTTGDGYYESCISGPENILIEITE